MEFIIIGIIIYTIYLVYKFKTAEPCIVCKGSGVISGSECLNCDGTGRKLN